MSDTLRSLKKLTFRYLSYIAARPKPWSDSALEGRKVLVVGSAPVSSPPVDFDDSYLVISVNASQIVAKAWGRAKPDITLMMFKQIEGENTNAREVRRVLNGESTGMLYMLVWKNGLPRLMKGLAAFNYRCDAVDIVNRNRRVALVKAMTGETNFEITNETKYSNGIIAVMLALYSGAERVVIAGINPASTGHIYNTENLNRRHSSRDLEALRRMQEKGLPVYTADADVAAATGLPLWTGSN